MTTTVTTITTNMVTNPGGRRIQSCLVLLFKNVQLSTKIVRHANSRVCFIYMEEESIETVTEESQIQGLLDKNVKLAISNISKN